MGWKSKLWIIPVAASLIAAGAALYLITPENAPWLPPCLFHKLTGLYCPGCGTARGLHRLVHGDLLGAWRMNPLMVLAIPLVVYLSISGHLRARHGAAAEAQPLPTWAPWLIVGVVAAFWIARNIPVYPFTLLAPH